MLTDTLHDDIVRAQDQAEHEGIDSPRSRVADHMVILMRVRARVQNALDMLGLSEVAGYEYLDEGVCPSCGAAFDHAQSTCVNCGPFLVEKFCWRPGP